MILKSAFCSLKILQETFEDHSVKRELSALTQLLDAMIDARNSIVDMQEV